MRILVVNKFWYRRAGLERVMFDEIRWLENAGHEVAHFSTLHPENQPSPWSDYFVPYLEIGPDSTLVPRQRALAAARMFWNGAAARQFTRILADFRPDVVHVHGIHRQISPSLLVIARRRGVPVVQSLHDYHAICSAGDLLLGGRHACEPPRCGGVNVIPCVAHKCVQHSRTKSVLAATELLSRRWLTRGPSLVDAFISPSEYLARVVSAGGGIQAHMHIIPNAVPCAPDSTSATRSDFFVYAGRLSREKGLNTLFKAVELAGVRLIVAGDGPLRQTLAAAKPAGVTMVGRVGGDEVDALLRDCRAAVVPSEWAENAPMAVLEPMALGRPVIATRMGGIPEQIRDGLDGILTTSGDVLELAAAMGLLAQDPALAARLGRSARDRVASRFSPARHTASLMRVYSSIVAGGADSTALL